MENIEKLTNCNLLLGWLNDNFKAITQISLNKQNYLEICGYYKNSKKESRYVIVNNHLIKITNDYKRYTFLTNGDSGINCKNINYINLENINNYKFYFMEYLNK